MFKVLKDITMVLYLVKIFQKSKWNKEFCWHIKSERIYTWQIHKIRKVKRNPLGKREIIPDRNTDSHKGMKSTKNRIYTTKHKKCFIFIPISTECISLLKIIKMCSGVYNISGSKTYESESIKPGRWEMKSSVF